MRAHGDDNFRENIRMKCKLKVSSSCIHGGNGQCVAPEDQGMNGMLEQGT